jgi:sulfoxide reductase heme-binding subunit YedZ
MLKLGKTQIIPFLATLTLSLLSVWYLVVERGSFSARIANKAAGDMAVLLLGIVLLIGPLSRFYDRFDRWLTYRKNLGLWAFVMAVIHTYLSLFVITNGNWLRYFTTFRPAPIAGLASMLVLSFLFYYSFDRLIGKLNRKSWWKMQNWGVKIAALLAVTHLVLLKSSDWAWSEFTTSLPPLNFWVAVFTGLVLMIRIVDWLKFKRSLVK